MRPLSLAAIAIVLGLGCREQRTEAAVSDDSPETEIPMMGFPAYDSIVPILNDYNHQRISADSAARGLLDTFARTGQSANLELDGPLRAALAREMQRRESIADSTIGTKAP